MKPTWREVTAELMGDGFAVLLDGRPIKRPGGAVLSVPWQGLAEAVAAEWRGAGLAGGDISPDDLPLTRLAMTAVERVAGARKAIIGQLAAYGLHDLLCYRAAGPDALVAWQAASWDGWLDWAEQKFGLRLAVGVGVLPVDQPAGTLAIFTAILEDVSDFGLAGLGVAIPALGSFVLGMAFYERALGADAVFGVALVEEAFQLERWGEDAQAAGRRAGILADLRVCERFWGLCG